MNWKFWQKPQQNDNTGAPKQKKLPGPKDLPLQIGQYLVLQEKKDPDWVWALKSVICPRDGSRSAFDVRVFSAQKAAGAGVRVANYSSLDGHPELILFQGWYDKASNQVELESTTMEKNSV